MEAIGIVGVGRLAGFLVEGLRHGGCTSRILLSPRGALRAAELARRFGCEVLADNQAVVDGAGIVVVAVPPRDVPTVVGCLHWRLGQRLVCVAIDVDLARLRTLAPNATVVRAMPSAAAAIGLGAVPVCPPDEVVERLLARVGLVFPVKDEAAFNAATALAGYHLWLFALMGEVAAEARAEGLPQGDAVRMVAELTRSAGALALAADPRVPMRAPLDMHGGSPDTMTAQGMAVLDAAKAFQPWRDAIDRSVRRLRRAQPRS
jgi:pyrroline-5-carboxylate reductase